MSNPLLEHSGLPKFSKIRVEHVEPAIDSVINDNREALTALLSQSEAFTWKNLIEPLEEMEDRLNRVWSPVSHMNSVVNSNELREAYNNCLSKLSDYATEMGQNQKLYQAILSIQESEHFSLFNDAQKKIITNSLRDFRLSGVALAENKKERFKKIMQDLSAKTSKFEENLLDATNAWSKNITDQAELAGLPKSAIDLAAQMAQQANKTGWLFNLDLPSYLPVMMYADSRELRQEVYTAYVTRASDEGPHGGQWDNSQLMEEILALRHEMAQLLGFENYAERSLATKMAQNPDQVIAFLEDLAQRSMPMAKNEMYELREFAEKNYGHKDLQSWDLAYYAEKLKEQRYQLSKEDLKPYFPHTQVIQGMFDIVERLYNMQIEEKSGVDTWHADVKFYEIRDRQGEIRGQFYLDLYARAKKRGGAWMDECLSRKRLREFQVPVAYLTCNFTPPIGNDPSLLTHDEVTTLFHEFGHGLHHMLTQVDYPSVAGISGVPWDAVELPSQFMENWCWEREALDLFAKHYQTGEVLPEVLYERMIAAKNFQSGMQMLRQIEFALFDFRIHREYDTNRGGRIFEILQQVRDQVAVVQPPSFNRFPHSFAHIFAGGYAAGYYSYKWAEVLSSDAFSRFEEQGIFDRSTGQAFLQTILEQGGSKEPMELFVEFRGREPQIDALLRHTGIMA